MSKDSDQQKIYTRRSALLVGGKLALLSALAGRMYYLQVVEAKRYHVLAEENRINLRLLIPPRGRLFDRFGLPIAVNREDYRAMVVAERAGDVSNTLNTLESIIVISKEDRERILKDVRKRRRFVPVTVNNDLTWKEVSQIEINAPDLPGVMIEEGLSRHYPYIDQCAHLLGYVGPVTETEQEGDKDPLMQLPDFRVGKSGIERQYEKALRGKSGESQIEINASGRVLRELSRRDGTAGKDLTLTIDAGLQTFAIKRLAEHESASAVVMDVHNGDVLAMANTPGYDPNAFIKGIKPKLWRSLLNNPKGPLTNKAIEGQYAPGSTFKVVVALAALESGLVSPYETFFCPGSLSLGSAKFHCWKRGGHGTMNMHNGLKKSCDVYFYNLALKLGLERIRKMALRLGLGNNVGIDLPHERPGLIPSDEWKRKQFGEKWYPGETVVAGIGQGYVLATPLQLAVMTSRIVNGGKAVTPRMVRAITEPAKPDKTKAVQAKLDKAAPVADPEFATLGIAQKSLQRVVKGMIAVVNETGGTAGRSKITEKGMTMGGKTGTSQVRRITRAERATGVIKNEDLPWNRRDHALFIGFAPADNPRYAVAVVVEHGGSGSRAAAPAARDIMREAQTRKSAELRRPGQAPGKTTGPSSH